MFFVAVRERLRLAAGVEELLAEFATTWPDPVQAPPDATLNALSHLRQTGWRIGVVTNGPPTQEEKLDRAGLRQYVDGCCVSSLVRSCKPHPAIFRLAAERCRSSLDGAWMVGDSLEDVAGAVAVGIRSVWLRRGRRWHETAYRPTLEADSFAEAVGLISTV
jgi:HAD superfamily hydrolase (TIGR01509 family)